MKIKKNSFLIILIAPSGGGKSTICDQILEKTDSIVYSISYTTRKPRGTEQNGIDYFFVSEEEFLEKIKQNDLLEYAKVHNHWYGTSKSFIQKQISNGKHVILDVDVQGANSIREHGMDNVSIFILPPKEDILIERLLNRGTDTKEQIQIRLQNSKAEIEQLNCFDYLVINDKLSKAVEEVKNIIIAEENKVTRYKNVLNCYYGGKDDKS